MGGVIKGVSATTSGGSNPNSAKRPPMTGHLAVGGGGAAGAGAGAALGGGTPSPQALASQVANLQAQVNQLTDLVHILWNEARQAAEYIQASPHGLEIRAGSACVAVERSGRITLTASQIVQHETGKR